MLPDLEILRSVALVAASPSATRMPSRYGRGVTLHKPFASVKSTFKSTGQRWGHGNIAERRRRPATARAWTNFKKRSPDRQDESALRDPSGGYLPSKKFRFLMINGRHFEGTANSSNMALTGHTDSQ